MNRVSTSPKAPIAFSCLLPQRLFFSLPFLNYPHPFHLCRLYSLDFAWLDLCQIIKKGFLHWIVRILLPFAFPLVEITLKTSMKLGYCLILSSGTDHGYFLRLLHRHTALPPSYPHNILLHLDLEGWRVICQGTGSWTVGLLNLLLAWEGRLKPVNFQDGLILWSVNQRFRKAS